MESSDKFKSRDDFAFLDLLFFFLDSFSIFATDAMNASSELVSKLRIDLAFLDLGS